MIGHQDYRKVLWAEIGEGLKGILRLWWGMIAVTYFSADSLIWVEKLINLCTSPISPHSSFPWDRSFHPRWELLSLSFCSPLQIAAHFYLLRGVPLDYPKSGPRNKQALLAAPLQPLWSRVWYHFDLYQKYHHHPDLLSHQPLDHQVYHLNLCHLMW